VKDEKEILADEKETLAKDNVKVVSTFDEKHIDYSKVQSSTLETDDVIDNDESVVESLALDNKVDEIDTLTGEFMDDTKISNIDEVDIKISTPIADRIETVAIDMNDIASLLHEGNKLGGAKRKFEQLE